MKLISNFFVLNLIIFTSAISIARQDKIDSSIKLKANHPQDVLIFLNQRANISAAGYIQDRVTRIKFVYDQLVTTANQSQPAIIQQIKKMKLNFRSFHVVNALLVEQASLSQISQLANFTEVHSISPNAQATLKLPDSQPNPGNEESNEILGNLVAVGADKVWNELNVAGEGIVIGIQDTGVQWTHEALKKSYRGSFGNTMIVHDYNWHDAIRKSSSASCVGNSFEPCDDKGHGSHVTGTVVGNDGGINLIGVAPKAKWIGCRNMDYGTGTAATYLECFEFFLAPYAYGGNPKTDGRPDKAPHIINNSWACPSAEDCKGNEFIEVVRNLKAAGIAVVAAVGNEGPSCNTSYNAPGSYSGELFSVAAFDHRNGEIADFSSRGPSAWNKGVGATISAPGENIRSAVVGSSNKSYDYKSGTSMAAPHVAGVIALLWSAQPQLIGQVDLTMDLLHRSADPKTSTQNCGNFPGASIPNAVFGYGAVNAYKAIKVSGY